MNPIRKTAIKNWLTNNFYRRPESSWMMMTRSELRQTLLATDGNILANGELWLIVNKHLGAGVYRVSLAKG